MASRPAEPAGERRLPLGRRIRYALQAAPLFGLLRLARAFDVGRASELGGSVGRRLAAPLLRRPSTLATIRIAFPGLDAAGAVALVDGIAGAIDHIDRYSSHHTEAVIAENPDVVERFFREIDSAILLHNASTQFADGGEFGMGGEIGIATGKMHARGPVGVEQLTSFKYRVRGAGQTRL